MLGPKTPAIPVPTFCFVIPCFNEGENVAATVGSVREALDERGDYEIILVNDASTDHTLERMQALAALDPHIRVLDNPVNLGFGGSYKHGAKAATATYVMMRVCRWKLARSAGCSCYQRDHHEEEYPTQRPLWLGCTTKSTASAYSIKVTALTQRHQAPYPLG
jgi:Glycosyl transferase family 2